MFSCFPFSYNFISNHLGLQSQCLTFIPCVCMQDILHHIYSVLPLRDAARAACSSHAFLRFWRCHPNLTLNWHILGSNANASQENFSCIIDNILRNHSGINIKILKFSYMAFMMPTSIWTVGFRLLLNLGLKNSPLSYVIDLPSGSADPDDLATASCILRYFTGLDPGK